MLRESRDFLTLLSVVGQVLSDDVNKIKLLIDVQIVRLNNFDENRDGKRVDKLR